MIFKKKKAMNEQELNQEELQDTSAAQADQNSNQEPTEQNTKTEELSAEEKLRNELAASKDQYLRLVAEFDNYRKRTAKEKQELILTANKDLMQSLISIIDDNERAGKTIETATDLQAVKEGFSLIVGKLHAILNSKGLKAMELQAGADFDPELHEAITEIPAPTEDLQSKVVDVIEKGYYLNEKLIRHAKVVVGK